MKPLLNYKNTESQVETFHPYCKIRKWDTYNVPIVVRLYGSLPYFILLRRQTFHTVVLPVGSWRRRLSSVTGSNRRQISSNDGLFDSVERPKFTIITIKLTVTIKNYINNG